MQPRIEPPNQPTNWSELGKKYSCLIIALVVIVVLVLAILLVLWLRSRLRAPQPAPVATTFPMLATKPRPVNAPFKGCPPEGDGGDPALNKLKNRIDEGNYMAVPFGVFVKLPWPKTIERRDRAKWSQSDAAEVARYEGTPVSIEGYLASSKEEGPESCNCHGADDEFRDFHVWLTENANDDRTNAIVVEVSPPVRAKHPNWTTSLLGQIARKDQRVRISGWTMLDPEHPDQVGKTRGSIWEVHPVMKIEVMQNGSWTEIDNLR